MPQKPNPRNSTVSQADWKKHELEIKRLWLEEGKPLPATMEIMSQKFNFKASYVHPSLYRGCWSSTISFANASSQYGAIQEANKKMEFVEVPAC